MSQDEGLAIWDQRRIKDFKVPLKAYCCVKSSEQDYQGFSYKSLRKNIWPLGWSRRHNLNNLGTGPLDDASCKISKL